MNENFIEQEIKGNFSESRYDSIKEFFYHVNADSYDIKVMITRRSYSLYKLFTDLLSYDGNVVYKGNAKPKKGLFLNSHSICYIDHFLSEHFQLHQNHRVRVLLVDDIIINGRTVSRYYKMIKRILDGANIELDYDLDVWCLALNESFNEEFGMPRSSIKTYWSTTNELWKPESTNLTQAIIKWGKGYTSYLKVYESNKSVDELIGLVSSIEGWKVGKLSSNTNLNEYYCAFKEDTNNEVIEAFRIYTSPRINACGAKSLIIPYVYIKKIALSDLMNRYSKLKTLYSLGDIPECFKNSNTNWYAASHFYKWLTYITSGILAQNIMHSFNIELNQVFDCEESFIGIDEKDYDSYYNDNEGVDSPSDDIASSTEIIKDYIKNENTIIEALKCYLLKMRDIDDDRARQRRSRCVGLSIDDILFNTNDDNKISMLTAIFNSWDTGLASGNVEYIKINDEVAIDTYIRQGEQVFNAIYVDYQKEFVILSYITKFFDSFVPKKLISIAKEFDHQYNGYKLSEFVNKLIDCNVGENKLYSDILGMEVIFNDLIKEKDELLEAKLKAYDFTNSKWEEVYS